MKRFFIPLFLCFLLSLFCVPASATDKQAEKTPSQAAQDAGAGFSPGTWLISFYRDHISAVDGDRCPSIPSCSSYSVQAFKKHGFIMGWFMTVDRLIHEGKEEEKVSPVVYSSGKWMIYDPIENNDFWWYHEHENREE
ncbi:MAG: membrane protein insertion efficiency factor YidD [Deltaproteobacteria bacterium]|nr:membrane protein insertion efficiency factor YidD [Deltaproteobacteria bacterium]